MTLPTLLAAAKPWTYWLAAPLLVADVVLIIALAVGYYRRVLVPQYEWVVHERLRRSVQPEQRATTLLPSSKGKAESWPRAA